jgi:hypothetical protein
MQCYDILIYYVMKALQVRKAFIYTFRERKVRNLFRTNNMASIHSPPDYVLLCR